MPCNSNTLTSLIYATSGFALGLRKIPNRPYLALLLHHEELIGLAIATPTHGGDSYSPVTSTVTPKELAILAQSLRSLTFAAS